MAQQQVQRSGTGAAFLWGGVFGVSSAALRLLGQFIILWRFARVVRVAIRPVVGLTLLGILFSLAAIACYFLAGMVAARRTGRIEPGIFAGLIAGSIVGLGTLALLLVGVGLVGPGILGGVGSRVPSPRVVMSLLLPILSIALSTAFVGTGLGALGALVGRPRGNTAGVGGGYAYQAGAMGPGAQAGGMPHATGLAPAGGYAAPTPPPPPPGYSTGEDAPTVQSESTPPTV